MRELETKFYIEQKNFWDKVKRTRFPTHPVIKAFAEPKINFILNELKKMAENPNELDVIELGAGCGYISYYLEKYFKKIVCTDISQSMLNLNPCQHKILAPAENLPFPDKSFDIAFSSNLLHHLNEPLLAIKEMKRIAKKYIIISDVNKKNLLLNIYGLIKKEERGITKLPKNYLDLYLNQINVPIIAKREVDIILTNKPPAFLLPALKYIERKKIFTSFYSTVIAKI